MIKQEMKICLWFDNQAEEATNYYTSIFKNSEIVLVSRFGKEGFEFHGMPEGTVMAMDFSLNEMQFTALNSNSKLKFNDSISIMVYCDTQEEIDYYWEALCKDGEEGPCGWLKDKFGVSWQIIPSILPQLLANGDAEISKKVTNAFLPMKKLDIETLKRAIKN